MTFEAGNGNEERDPEYRLHCTKSASHDEAERNPEEHVGRADEDAVSVALGGAVSIIDWGGEEVNLLPDTGGAWAFLNGEFFKI
jgi:hypothetical protein